MCFGQKFMVSDGQVCTAFAVCRERKIQRELLLAQKRWQQSKEKHEPSKGSRDSLAPIIKLVLKKTSDNLFPDDILLNLSDKASGTSLTFLLLMKRSVRLLLDASMVKYLAFFSSTYE